MNPVSRRLFFAAESTVGICVHKLHELTKKVQAYFMSFLQAVLSWFFKKDDQPRIPEQLYRSAVHAPDNLIPNVVIENPIEQGEPEPVNHEELEEGAPLVEDPIAQEEFEPVNPEAAEGEAPPVENPKEGWKQKLRRWIFPCTKSQQKQKRNMDFPRLSLNGPQKEEPF